MAKFFKIPAVVACTWLIFAATAYILALCAAAAGL